MVSRVIEPNSLNGKQNYFIPLPKIVFFGRLCEMLLVLKRRDFEILGVYSMGVYIYWHLALNHTENGCFGIFN